MITLPNGHELEYVAASGALGFDGRGWPHERVFSRMGLYDPLTVTLKTLTRIPREGNVKFGLKEFPWFGCFRALDAKGGALSRYEFFCEDSRIKGFVNAVGLRNEGIMSATRKYPKIIQKRNIKAIGSLYADTVADAVFIAKQFNKWPLIALELNASCPNSGKDISKNTLFVMDMCREVSCVTQFPLILKLSYDNDYVPIVRVLQKYISAISFNTIKYGTVFPGKQNPLEHLGGGGVSGAVCHHYYKKMAEHIAGLWSIPLLLPIWKYSDMRKWALLGKRYHTDVAFAFGSRFIRWPLKPALFIKRREEAKAKVCRCYTI